MGTIDKSRRRTKRRFEGKTKEKEIGQNNGQ
jgi:hypothetical protein